jgi:transcriptional regulator with XRE-family HTH domain
MANFTTLSPAVNAKDEQFFKTLGARIAQGRKARNLTQQQLADELGVAQQTLAHYEGGRLRLPASLLPALAQTLQVPVELLLGQPRSPRSTGKRGPPSKLEEQIERVAQLPRAKQRFVMDMLDAALSQQG